MTRRRPLAVAAALAAAALLTSCSSDMPADSAAGAASKSAAKGADKPSKFFQQAEYERQLALAEAAPEGPADKPWEQMLEPEMTDTAQYR
ncbi:ABC transporter substrate-binding protein, partial [Streptomyces sp. NPDC056689]